MKINLIATSVKNSIFNKGTSDDLCGKIGGVCYMTNTFDDLLNEDPNKTLKRIARTMGGGHHSVFEHIYITLNLENIPKLFAMVLNNENVYVTSEKSARYTKMKMTEKEEELYNKWFKIFEKKIKEKYSNNNFISDQRITKLAQENARYLISVKTPTTMVHTISYRQLNYLCKWMQDELNNTNSKYALIHETFASFIGFAKQNNLLDERLMDDGKYRHLSLFNYGEQKSEIYDTVYSANYDASFAYLAQAQRHRTINYEINKIKAGEFFTPKILLQNDLQVEEWQGDLYRLKDNLPQATLLSINERATVENFILKLKERLCACAQLEINDKTKEILFKYIKQTNDNELKEILTQYSKGSRCTFPDFKCSAPCGWVDGIKGEREI